MKLSFTAFVLSVGVVQGFTAGLNKQQQSFSKTALFDSRNAQKIEAKTAWLEKRGYDSDGMKINSEGEAGQLTNEDGLEYVRLVHPSGASSEIYLFGGDVTSYKDKDGHEYIAVRPDAKMDGSKPISGGLSHCWPQFGPGEIQQHGFARNVNWGIESLSDTAVTLSMVPSAYTKNIWDKDFKCLFTVEVDENELKTTHAIENTGEGDDASFDFQAALHSYFAVSSIGDLEIDGSFEGKEFLNKMVGDGGEMQTETRSTITIGEEYDRVYTGVSDPVLKDKGSKKTLSVVNSAGYEDTVVWNPYGDEGMGYDNFVCVESVKFDPVTLGAGETWEGVMNLVPGVLEEAATEEAAAEEAAEETETAEA